MDREALARAVVEAMWRAERACKRLGIAIEAVGPGYARLAMTVAEDMVNGQLFCHGGFIYTLADASFGFAANSHNHRALGAACSIEYLAPARVGERLTAECREQAIAGRTGIYDSRVTNPEGALVALFRGKSATVRGTWVEQA